jgi:hypothetical protein
MSGRNTQSQIKRTLLQPVAIECIRELLVRHAFQHRTAVADSLCVQLGFSDARGAPQRGSCLKALQELEAAGEFTLPAARTETDPKTPRGADPGPRPPRPGTGRRRRR